MQHSLKSRRIFLIGGGAGVGKTSVAHVLAHHLGISVLLVDDLRMAIQQVTTPGEQPGIHYFMAHPTIWQKAPEVALDGFIAVGEAMRRPLTAVIAHHLFSAEAGSMIIEGENILPALAAQSSFPSLHFSSSQESNDVRAVFLVEPDEAVIARRLGRHKHNISDISPKEQQTVIRATWLYGQWLKRHAESYDLPVIEPRPWDTLAERLLQALMH